MLTQLDLPKRFASFTRKIIRSYIMTKFHIPTEINGCFTCQTLKGKKHYYLNFLKK